MATGTAGQNAADLQALGTAKRATAPAIAAGFKDAKNPLEGAVLPVTRVGDATWTTIVVPHTLQAAPSGMQFTPTSAAAGLAAAAYWLTKDATNVTVNFAAAPANAASVTGSLVVFI